MKSNWFVKQEGFTEGPLSFRELLEGLVALKDWRTLQIRHGKINGWFMAEQLESRASRAGERRSRLTSAALLVAGAILGAALTMPFVQSLPAQLKEVADPALGQRTGIANKLMKARASLPRKIDQHAIRTDISYDDPVLTFSNILLLQSANVPDNVRTDISRAVIKNTCAFAQARQFMTAGGTIAFNYTDIDAQPFAKILVAEQSCF